MVEIGQNRSIPILKRRQKESKGGSEFLIESHVPFLILSRRLRRRGSLIDVVDGPCARIFGKSPIEVHIFSRAFFVLDVPFSQLFADIPIILAIGEPPRQEGAALSTKRFFTLNADRFLGIMRPAVWSMPMALYIVLITLVSPGQRPEVHLPKPPDTVRQRNPSLRKQASPPVSKEEAFFPEWR